MLKQIKETVEYLKSVTDTTPEIGIILGTGLGGLVSEIDIKFSIPYSDIPNFKSSLLRSLISSESVVNENKLLY